MTVAEGNNSMCLLVLNRRGRNPDPLLIHLPMCPLTYRQCPPTREMLATGLSICRTTRKPNRVTVASRTTEIWPFEFRQLSTLDKV